MLSRSYNILLCRCICDLGEIFRSLSAGGSADEGGVGVRFGVGEATGALFWGDSGCACFFGEGGPVGIGGKPCKNEA